MKLSMVQWNVNEFNCSRKYNETGTQSHSWQVYEMWVLFLHGLKSIHFIIYLWKPQDMRAILNMRAFHFRSTTSFPESIYKKLEKWKCPWFMAISWSAHFFANTLGSSNTGTKSKANHEKQKGIPIVCTEFDCFNMYFVL